MNGYIAINGNRVIRTVYGCRGFYLIELNATSCSLSNSRQFDTYASSTNPYNIATYINSLPLNTVLIGVTADEPQNNLDQKATSALLAIGVKVTGLQFRGKVSFVAQIGQPAISLSQVAPPGGIGLKMSVNMTGTFTCF